MFGREPVLWSAAIRGVLLAVMAFGLKVTAEQLAAVMVGVEAVLALISRANVTPNSTLKANGVSPSSLTRALIPVAVASTLFAAPAAAEWKRLDDLSRFSFGATASAAMYEDRESGAREWGWQPSAYGSWSFTEHLSLAGSVSRDFGRDLNVVQGGVRLAVLGTKAGDSITAGFGVDAVHYGDDGAAAYAHTDSWLASVRLAWSVWKSSPTRDILWAVAQAETDPNNGSAGSTTYKLGLRWQAIGP